jgi:hypothetical protein
MSTRRTFQNRECFLQCKTLEDSIDLIEYSPFFKSLLSRLPTQKTGMVLFCLQSDFSPPFLQYVVDAFRRIKLDDIDGRNQFLTREFFFWLRVS